MYIYSPVQALAMIVSVLLITVLKGEEKVEISVCAYSAWRQLPRLGELSRLKPGTRGKAGWPSRGTLLCQPSDPPLRVTLPPAFSCKSGKRNEWYAEENNGCAAERKQRRQTWKLLVLKGLERVETSVCACSAWHQLARPQGAPYFVNRVTLPSGWP